MGKSTELELYRKEFPNFGVLDIELPEGFTDVSWHNNWIDYLNERKRDFPECPRFTLICNKRARCLIATHNYQNVLNYLASDHFKELHLWLRKEDYS